MTRLLSSGQGSATRESVARSTLAYKVVVSMDACPKKSAICLSVAPAFNMRLARLRRNTWVPCTRSRNPARHARRKTTWQMPRGVSGFPSGAWCRMNTAGRRASRTAMLEIGSSMQSISAESSERRPPLAPCAGGAAARELQSQRRRFPGSPRPIPQSQFTQTQDNCVIAPA